MGGTISVWNININSGHISRLDPSFAQMVKRSLMPPLTTGVAEIVPNALSASLTGGSWASAVSDGTLGFAVAAGPIDWADLASGAGYFDQAHFGHEFREFTGLTPTRYVEVRQRFLREHPGHTLDGWPLPAD